MIRTVTLGVVCLAGLGAIAAAAKRPATAPTPELVFPVIAGNKSDRLTFSRNQGTLTTVDEVDVSYTPASPNQLADIPAPAREATNRPPPDFVPRHWHDPHDLKAKAGIPKAGDTRQAKTRPPAITSTQVADARSCRTDGLDPLLRKLNLSPPCDP